MLDANVVVRFLVADDPELYRQARAILDPVHRGEREAILLQVTLAEVVFVLTSVYRSTKTATIEGLERVLAMRGLVGEHVDDMKAALGLFSRHNFSIVDALIAAYAARRGLKLVTFDRDLQKIAASARLRIVP